jgi:parallel beta-helix repeat protein
MNIRPGSLIVAAAVLFTAADLPAQTSSVECGAVVLEDLKLKEDLGPCPGDGLVIGTSGIHIDLNGHKVFAAQRANVGIRLEGWSNVTVKGGAVEGFDTGVLVSGGQEHTLAKLSLRNNRFGLRIADAPNSRHRIDGNVVAGNRLIGVLLSPFVEGVTLSKSDVSDNAGYGIVLDGASAFNVVQGNTAHRNGARDIELREQKVLFQRANVVAPALQALSPARPPYVEGVDFHAAAGNGSTPFARLVPVGIALDSAATAFANPDPADTSTSGCKAGDFTAAGFQPGDVALIQRGTCTLDRKVVNAVKAGAAGIVIFNEGQAPHRLSHDFGTVGEPTPGALIGPPTLLASYATGFELFGLARSGPVGIRIVAGTQLLPSPVVPATHDNGVSKNAAASASDENMVCGTNHWTKNSFDHVNQECVDGLPQGGGGGPGGIGATSHNY